MNKQEIVQNFLSRNYLVSPSFLDSFNNEEDFDDLDNKLKGRIRPVILNEDILKLLKRNNFNLEINWLEFEKSRTSLEKGRDVKIYETFLNLFFYDNLEPNKKREIDEISNQIKKPETSLMMEKERASNEVIVLKNYLDEENKKKEVKSFVDYFMLRYAALRKILMGRTELNNVISINKALNKKGREIVALIGLVADKRISKNGNIIINLEDNTGTINVIINKNKDRLYKLAKDLVLDETIGLVGFNGEGVVFINEIYLPDIPLNKEIKKSKEDICVGVISDIHVGSVNFLEKEFLEFIDWLNGNGKNKEHRELALRIKYLFIVGDLIDGVGIYPGQEKDLYIKDVKEQYDKLAYYLSLIRSDLKIVISPGNHDPMRLSLPQPVLDKRYAEGLYKLKNVIFVTNPAYVNIASTKDFPGFDALLYHGNSFHYYIDNVDSLRWGNAKDYPSKISKFLLQRRHLAPSHTSTLYIPDEREDPLVIDRVPDLVFTGEMHRTDIGSYNNIIIINSSCWQKKTDYEEKVGNNPDPGKFPVLNLKTREVSIIKFYDESN